MTSSDTRTRDDLDLLASVMPEGIAQSANAGLPVLEGLGEWLFDPQRMGAVTGDVRLTQRALRSWQRTLEIRSSWVTAHDGAYRLMVAPAKHVVYPELLPDRVTVATVRAVRQLEQHLSEHADAARVLYPAAELSAADPRATFAYHDSHWNSNGAFVAYEALIGDLAQEADVRRLSREDVGFSWREARGDLSCRIDPDRCLRTLLGRPHPRLAGLLFDSRIPGEGRVLITECAEATPTALVFGDDCAYRLLPFLAESFRRLVFVHSRFLDFELVEDERPDIVVSVIAEQELLDVPLDVFAAPSREVALRRLAAGVELACDLAPMWGMQRAGHLD